MYSKSKKSGASDKTSFAKSSKNSKKSGKVLLPETAEEELLNHQANLSDTRIQRKEQSSYSAKAAQGIESGYEVSSPGEPLEKEADAVAEHVVSNSSSGKSLPSISGATTKLKNEQNLMRLASAGAKKDKKEIESAGPAKSDIQRKPESGEKEEIESAGPAKSDIQRKPESGGKKKKEKQLPPANKVQRSAKNDTSSTSSDSVSSNFTNSLENTKSGGQSLSDDVGSDMEAKIGSSFRDVRIHTDSAAANLSHQVNAQAFTHGQHIYFSKGRFNPSSPSGKGLLAHELTHTIHQSGGRSNKTGNVIQRQVDSSETTSESGSGENLSGTGPEIDYVDQFKAAEGEINLQVTPKKMTIPILSVPEVKKGEIPESDLTIRKGGEVRETRQRTIWDSETRGAQGHMDKLTAKIGDPPPPFSNTIGPFYYLKIGSTDNYLTGNRTEIRNRLLRPFWTKDGDIQTFDVDHKKDWQLGGEDVIGNMWLLESRANMSMGPRITGQVNSGISSLLTASAGAVIWQNRERPDVATAKRDYDITFTNMVFNLSYNKNFGPAFYNRADIEAGQQVEVLHNIEDRDELIRLGLLGTTSQFVIYNNARGGRVKTVSMEPNEDGEILFTDRDFVPGFKPSDVVHTPGENINLTIHGKFWADNPALAGHGESKEISVRKMRNRPHTGYVDLERLENEIKEMFGTGEVQVAKASPVEVESVAFDEQNNIEVLGKINSNIPLIGKADIDFAIRGDSVEVRKTFNASELRVPRPFSITDSSLTIIINSETGLTVTGEAAFVIENFGEGFVHGASSMEEGFSVEGEFNFDTNLFEKAKVTVSYRNEVLSLSGELVIGEGKLPGVKSARITPNYREGIISGEGDAELDIPGVDRGTFNFSYSEESFALGGEFGLTDEIPGISGGSIHASVVREGGEYDLTMGGRATPDIPGIDSELTIEYAEGILTIGAEAAYSRGLLSGTLDLTVTNRSSDNEGQPTGAPSREFNVFGGGSLTAQLSPWLQAKAAVKFTPQGELEVFGEIRLPSSFELFKRIPIETPPLFRMPTLEIPLFAIPLGPTSIGIVATISGGLDASAGIGPGTIEELSASVTYNPAHEEDTRISGTGKLVIPADAGLRLYARAGIGMSVGIARVSGNIEIGGELGVKAAAELAVTLEWSPSSGLEIIGDAKVHAEPKFIFDIAAVLEAKALWKSIEWRYSLAKFEYGSDMMFGITFPIHYIEGQPFDISLADVEFEKPDIDILEFVKDLGRKIID